MFLHSLILQFIEIIEAENILENTRRDDIKIEFSDFTCCENRNVELSGLKKEQIKKLEISLNEIKKSIENGIKESTIEELQTLKEKIRFDINKLSKELENADINLHTYSKLTDEYLLQKKYISVGKNSSLLALKYQSYNSARIKLDLIYDILLYIDYIIDNKSNVKIKK